MIPKRHKCPGLRAARPAALLLAAVAAVLWVAGPLAGDEKPLAVALGIAARQGGEYVEAARSVADAISAELAKADEFEILFFDAESPPVKRAVLEGRLEGEMLAQIGTSEGFRAVLAQLGARFGIDVSLEAVSMGAESIRVDLSIRVLDLTDPRQHEFTASGGDAAGESNVESLRRAAASAGTEAGLAIRRRIAASVASSGGAVGREKLRGLETSARSKLSSDDASGALQDLEAACQIDPKNPELRKLKAQAYDAVGELDRAIVEARRAVFLDDSDAEARFMLGELYLKGKEASRAVGELKEAISLGMDNHEVRMAIGEAYMSQGLVVQAEEHFETAAELAPKDLATALRLGEMYERSRSSEAESLYSAFLEQQESSQVRIRLAAVLVKKKDYEAARTHLGLAASQADADFSDPDDYAPCAAVIDHEVMDVTNRFRVSLFEYVDEQIAREELHELSKALSDRARQTRDLAERIVPPQGLDAAHGHRRYAAELLVQAAINFQSHVETDRASMRDQYELLQNEAIKEIAAARTARQ